MDASISISNDDAGSATLGGAIVLQNGPRHAITNWHCVGDAVIDSGEFLILSVKHAWMGETVESFLIFIILNSDRKVQGWLLNTTKLDFESITTPSNSDHSGYMDVVRRRRDAH